MSIALQVENLNTFYGKSHILQGIGLEVREGEIVALLGRNGAGKSTTLKSVCGALRPAQGAIRFRGKDIAGWPAFRAAQEGLLLVPEDRGIFGLLTVEENLRISQRKGSPWSLKDIYRMFPRLEERRRNNGGQLSGGEQQMLSIARALLNHPRLLMLDEPVEGLAPVIVDEIVNQVLEIKQRGIPILIVEQNLAVCAKIADRNYIIELGKIAYHADAVTFANDDEARDRYLGVKAD
ncbi:ABC transporter ATP-binding protein [Pseudochelatococcus contaminans]|uniref:Branched-chain amino acid transport system ATP-binding protein n=1 Tax=Pseudochelatococcus contaminans TaxID=1538103 RepID=A0A7W6EHZ1_9HYPH|nr:ABC transporter ATP-binding protein [Pseudochelatococcus contaminans]MBB3810560.1 branched-chain amino acid transport system ATP-binding protein [Pseudochelatococcus contaminans]